jgi:hypothetical protein
LYIEGNQNPVNISIYNMLGKEVISLNNPDKVDVSSLSNGVYFINLIDGNNSVTKKIIKD